MSKLLSTREVAAYLGINEKKVYSLITESGLPGTKATGKWLFPEHLVEQWVESRTVNVPQQKTCLDANPDLLLIGGSNDLLLERTMGLYMELRPERVAAFANLGSLGGLQALRRGLCHLAASHLVQDDDKDYNFAQAEGVLGTLPAVVNFSRREQGLLVPRGNPHSIQSVADVVRQGLTVVNRPVGTGTRLLFERELDRAGGDPANLSGFDRELARHLDVGLEVLAGRADTGPAIRAVAALLGLDFVSMGWERFDLLIPKERYFDQHIQEFLELLDSGEFARLAQGLTGYDVSESGKVLFPTET